MKTCLIVDDSRVIRTAAGRIVAELGFSVEEASNGQQALDICGQRRPDAILLDWNMPIMDGMEFLLALPESADGTKPLVIFCTTESSMEHIQKALEAGANEYIMKPFDREILEAKFRQIGLLA